MAPRIQSRWWSLSIVLALAGTASAVDVTFTLTGKQAVKAVTTAATGTGWFKIGDDDHTISGSITTSGVAGIAAHLHLAPMGRNGPAILTLDGVSETEWRIPPDAKLTDDQYAAFKAGRLYVDVHSATYKNGELRGQLIP